jgi:hypothetical protein
MKRAAYLIGILLVAVGALWTFQGYGTLKGSFMTGSRFWLWAGIACLVAGFSVLVRSLRRKG